MRGLAAHSNGFQTIRALAILMSAARHDRPARRLPAQGAVPARDSADRPSRPNSPRRCKPEHAARRHSPLGWPARPDDLFVDDDGEPVRIDKAFSWEYPLAVHGLMHNVITNAWRGDPVSASTRC